MKWLAIIFGNIWMLPNTIFSALYLGALALFGQVGFVRFTSWAIMLQAKKGTWLANKGMKQWAGWASGVFIILRHDYTSCQRTVTHEERHVKQQMIFGVLQPILYFLASVFIWVFLRSKHSYLDNPFERDARRAAGQRVDIPRDQWNDPNDRWAWW